MRFDERVGGACIVAGSLLLGLYAVLFGLFVPMGDGPFDYLPAVVSPHWRWIALVAFVGTLLVLAGLDAVYARIRPAAGVMAAAGLLLTKVALVMQAAILTWELLLEPVMASHPESAFLLRDGVISRAPGMAAFIGTFFVCLIAGAILFGVAILRSGRFARGPIALVVAGAVTYAVGPMVSVYVGLAGLLLVALGGTAIGVALWRTPATR
jgi:hypothetical protein